MHDHIHMLIEIQPKYSVSNLVGLILGKMYRQCGEGKELICSYIREQEREDESSDLPGCREKIRVAEQVMQ